MNRTTRLCLLMASIFAGCGDGRDYGMYTDVLEEIDLRGHGGTTSIVSALNSSDPYLQKLAVEGLGRFESEEHIVQIADVLDSRDSEVRQSAVNALGQSVFGTHGDEVSDILLKHLLIEENGVVRGTIARTLGRLSLLEKSKTTAIVDALIEMTGPNIVSVDQSIILGVVMGLESMIRLEQFDENGIPDEAVDFLKEILLSYGSDGVEEVPYSQSRATVRRVAALAISSLEQIESEILERVAKDPDPGVRRIAIMALGEKLEVSMEVLRAGLLDQEAMVRTEAVRSYANQAQGAESCQVLISMIQDESLHVSLAVLNLISGECEKGFGAETVLTSLISDPSKKNLHNNWHRAAHALVAMAELSSDVANLLIEDFMSHQSPFARSYAARAATITGNLRVLNILTEDANPNVRVQALGGLFAVEGSVPDSIIIDQLSTSDPFLMLTAARLLEGSLNHTEAIGPLIDSLDRMSKQGKETHRDPRMALLERIGEFGNSEQVEALEPYLRDYDPIVAEKTSEILSDWTGMDRKANAQLQDPLAFPSWIDIEEMRSTVVTLHMDRGGEISIQLIPDLAPTHAYRFKNLAEDGQLDGLTFHRVVSNFVIQGLSPGANEYAGYPEYTRDEIGLLPHWRGTVGTSTRGRDTGDGQIFVNLIDNHNLNHDFTIFGYVSRPQDMEVVDAVAEGDVISKATVATLGEN